MNFQKIILTIFLFQIITFGSYAQKTKSEEITVKNNKKYFVHTIAHGQSLSAISKIYQVTVSDLMAANGLKDDFVREGDKLLVPYNESSNIVQENNAKEEAKQDVKASGGKEYIVYIPKEGETLYSLSQKFQVSIREIIEANGGEQGQLKSGIKANVPVKIPVSQETLANIEHLTQDSLRGYFLYTIQKSETLYGIAWRYETTVDMILLFNPGVTPMIEEGQLLKIPLKNTSVNYTIHKVDKKITVAKLAKSYNLEPYEIKAINPGLDEELKVGQQVKIPIKTEVETVKVDQIAKEPTKEETKEETSLLLIPETATQQETPVEVVSLLSSDCKKINANKEIQVALLIPFYLDNIDTTLSQPESESAGALNSFSFIHFYEGCMIAVDSLESEGVNAIVHVFDVTDDESAVKKLLRNPDLKKMDLIIGPFLGTSFTAVAEFARTNQIPIINPFSYRDEIIKDNPGVIKIKPGIGSQFPQLADFISRTYPDAHIFAIRENKTRDTQAFEELKINLYSGLKDVSRDNFHFINSGRDSLKLLPVMFSETKTNLLIIFTENKAFALDCIRKISEGRSGKDVRIIGMPRWDKFQFTELDYLVDLKAHYFTPSFVDYSDAKTNQFIKKFKTKFEAEPEPYAFEGFDIMWFFMNAMSKYGNQFEQCIAVHNPDLLQNQIHLKKMGSNGWENQYWNFLKYSDYRLIRATPYSKLFD